MGFDMITNDDHCRHHAAVKFLKACGDTFFSSCFLLWYQKIFITVDFCGI